MLRPEVAVSAHRTAMCSKLTLPRATPWFKQRGHSLPNLPEMLRSDTICQPLIGWQLLLPDWSQFAGLFADWLSGSGPFAVWLLKTTLQLRGQFFCPSYFWVQSAEKKDCTQPLFNRSGDSFWKSHFQWFCLHILLSTCKHCLMIADRYLERFCLALCKTSKWYLLAFSNIMWN